MNNLKTAAGELLPKDEGGFTWFQFQSDLSIVRLIGLVVEYVLPCVQSIWGRRLYGTVMVGVVKDDLEGFAVA